MSTIKSICLTQDDSNTNSQYVEIRHVGGCILVEIYSNSTHAPVLTYQLSDYKFRTWAKAFQLFSEDL